MGVKNKKRVRELTQAEKEEISRKAINRIQNKDSRGNFKIVRFIKNVIKLFRGSYD